MGAGKIGRQRAHQALLLHGRVDLVVRGHGQADLASSGPERSQILSLCELPVSVAEVAAFIGLPLGVVRVLLADMMEGGLSDIMRSAPRGPVTDHSLLGRVLAGLRALRNWRRQSHQGRAAGGG